MDPLLPRFAVFREKQFRGAWALDAHKLVEDRSQNAG